MYFGKMANDDGVYGSSGDWMKSNAIVLRSYIFAQNYIYLYHHIYIYIYIYIILLVHVSIQKNLRVTPLHAIYMKRKI